MPTFAPRYEFPTVARFVGSVNQYDLYFYPHTRSAYAVTHNDVIMLAPHSDDALVDTLYQEAEIRFERQSLPVIEVSHG